MAMTREDVVDCFRSLQSGDEWKRFERVENKLSTRMDIHAFLILESVYPGVDSSMIRGVNENGVWLDFCVDYLATVATPELIVDLCRCGVTVCEYNELLEIHVGD